MQPLWAGQPPETKRVLVLYSEENGHPAHELTARGIRSAFASNTLFDVQVYNEYLDVTRFSSPAHAQAFADYLRRKYDGIKIDTIITVYPAAAEFLLKEKETLRLHEQDLSKLTGRIIYAQEEELKRLSRELHDDLTQRLAALALDAALIETQLTPSQPRAVKDLKDLRANLSEVAEEVHDLSRQLHPSILDDLGLVQAVQAECDAFTKKAGIDLTFAHHNLPDSIPKPSALCLYRVIQEGLQNIAKHSQTAAASITLQGLSGGVRLLIQDKGTGFDSEEVRKKSGIGLSSMRERARLVNGTIAFNSEPGQGTAIEVFIPLGGGHDQATAVDS